MVKIWKTGKFIKLEHILIYFVCFQMLSGTPSRGFGWIWELIFGELEAYIAISCIIGLAISYTSIWAQTLISATSFLVTWQGKNCLNLWADTPPKKKTWQWKTNYLKMYPLFKMLIFHRHLSFRACIPNWSEFYEWALRWIELDAWSSVTLAAAKVMVNANKFVIIAIEDHGRPLGSWRTGELGVEAISWEFRFWQPLLHLSSCPMAARV